MIFKYKIIIFNSLKATQKSYAMDFLENNSYTLIGSFSTIAAVKFIGVKRVYRFVAKRIGATFVLGATVVVLCSLYVKYMLGLTHKISINLELKDDENKVDENKVD